MITGFTISKVEGNIESFEALQRQRYPRINYNMKDMEGSGEKLKAVYEFEAVYYDGDAKDAKTIGGLKIHGTVEIKDTKESVASIIKTWKDTGVPPKKVSEEIVESLNFRCGATGTLVAYALGLIPPLVVPKINIEEKK